MTETLVKARHPSDRIEPRLGLRVNLAQFVLLVIVNAFVGAMVGIERTVVPLLGEQEFGIASKTAILSFIASFGLVKAFANLFAGRLADSLGRKKILVAGWLIGIPVPIIVMLAPSWSWIVFANLLLGANQGLAWSMTIISKIDLVGPRRRGLAMGCNEFAGYVAVGLTALATGYIAAAYALRPYPFYLGLIFALAGLTLSYFWVIETKPYAVLEANNNSNSGNLISFREIFALTSWKNKSLFSCSQAGLVNNLNDGIAWGLFPLLLASRALNVSQIGVIVAIYPATWGLSQLATGVASDRFGRKWLIVSGMWLQAAGIWMILYTAEFLEWVSGSVLLGLGTALVYPTLISAVSDVIQPEARASSIGVYRFWRDSGYVAGAVSIGFLADQLSVDFAINMTSWLTFFSGAVVAFVMRETMSRRQNS